MKRLAILVLALSLFTVLCSSSPTAQALSVTNPPANYLSPVFISAFNIASAGEVDVVEFYNSTDTAINMKNWTMTVSANSGVACTAKITASDIYIPPKSYVLAAKEGVFSAPQVRSLSDTCTLGVQANNLRLASPLQTEETINGIASSGSFQRLGLTATYRDEDDLFSRNFGPLSARNPASFFAGNWHYREPQTSLQIVSVLPKSNDCSPAEDVLGCRDFIKLYNSSLSPIDLSKFRLRSGYAGQNATASNTAYPSGMLLSGSYSAYSISVTDSGTYVWIEDVYGIGSPYGVVTVPNAASRTGQAWVFDSTTATWRWTKFLAPIDGPNVFTDESVINQCSGLRLSEIGANISPQFIEVQNSTTQSIDISGCQIQTNRSQMANYSFPARTVLAPGELRSLFIADTPLALTKTTSGTVYVLTSDGMSEVDARAYENLSSDTSYALVDGIWRQTFVATPGVANLYEEYPPCESGYIRNPDSGRCNKIAITANSSLTPCLPTQYRNEETNRCRNLVTAASSSLTPCAANQYRSPETNRCRLLATAASSLVPCKENQQRNPETNRCRNISASMPVAGFAPTKTNSANSSSPYGWVAIVGLGVLAVGYGLWEWRYEISKAVTVILARVRKL